MKRMKRPKEEPVNIKTGIRKIDIAKSGDFAVIETELVAVVNRTAARTCDRELLQFAGITTTRDLIEVERKIYKLLVNKFTL